jgi:serine/threonine-protein kinase HipA
MVARIDLWDTVIGAVAWDDQQGFARVEFTDAYYRSDWNIAPLTMPKEKRMIHRFPTLPKETFMGLPGALSDALPDRFGSQVLDAWLASKGSSIAELTPVERLLYQGKRGMGALEFQPANMEYKTPLANIEIDSLVKVANSILHERNALVLPLNDINEQDMSQLIQVGTSAGGARAKAVIAINRKTKEIRSGQLNLPKDFEHYIIKFDGVDQQNLGDPKGFGRIEYAYYLMAMDCGIDMMPSELWEENGRAHFITQRFDRLNGEKLHMQTLCAMAHYDYNNATAYSYEQAFQVMRSLRLPFSDAEKLYRRMVFNAMAQNCDDHTKNISFLMDKMGEWRLSPAYDMTFAYNPNGQWTHHHQMSVNSKREGIDRNDLLSVAKSMNIKRGKSIMDEVTASVSNWMHFAEQAAISSEQAEYIKGLHQKL